MRIKYLSLSFALCGSCVDGSVPKASSESGDCPVNVSTLVAGASLSVEALSGDSAVVTSCGSDFGDPSGPEQVFDFEVLEPSVVQISVLPTNVGPGNEFAVAVARGCPSGSAVGELACRAQNSVAVTLDPGHYFAIVEQLSGELGPFSISMVQTEPAFQICEEAAVLEEGAPVALGRVGGEVPSCLRESLDATFTTSYLAVNVPPQTRAVVQAGDQLYVLDDCTATTCSVFSDHRFDNRTDTDVALTIAVSRRDEGPNSALTASLSLAPLHQNRTCEEAITIETGTITGGGRVGEGVDLACGNRTLRPLYYRIAVPAQTALRVVCDGIVGLALSCTEPVCPISNFQRFDNPSDQVVDVIIAALGPIRVSFE